MVQYMIFSGTSSFYNFSKIVSCCVVFGVEIEKKDSAIVLDSSLFGTCAVVGTLVGTKLGPLHSAPPAAAGTVQATQRHLANFLFNSYYLLFIYLFIYYYRFAEKTSFPFALL